MDANQYLVVADGRKVDLSHLEHIGCAVFAIDDSLHGSPWCQPVAQTLVTRSDRHKPPGFDVPVGRGALEVFPVLDEADESG